MPYSQPRSEETLERLRLNSRRWYEQRLEHIAIPAVCPLLGIPLERGSSGTTPNSPSIDRINPKGGYIPGNVWVISHRANRIKNDATAEELMRMAQTLAKRIA